MITKVSVLVHQGEREGVGVYIYMGAYKKIFEMWGKLRYIWGGGGGLLSKNGQTGNHTYHGKYAATSLLCSIYGIEMCAIKQHSISHSMTICCINYCTFFKYFSA